MIKQPLKSKKAQIIGLAIVLIAIGILSGAALYMTNTSGNQISGMVTIDSDDGCNLIWSENNTVYNITSNIDCGAYDFAQIIGNNVTVDCAGKIISGNVPSTEPAFSIFAGIGAGLKNITIRNCIITGFDTGIAIIGTTSGTMTIEDIVVENNDISNNVNNCIFITVGGTGTVNLVDINVTGNTLDCPKDFDFSRTTGSGSSTDVRIFLNNFMQSGINNDESGMDFCIPLFDGVVQGTFGNYYDYTDDPYDSSVGVKGCNVGTVFEALLPDYYNGVLPLFCGLNITDDLTLTSNLKNNTGGYYCPAGGLTISNDYLTLDCDFHSIRGDNNSNSGINYSDHSGVTVKNCYISNFSKGVMFGSTSAGADSNILYNNHIFKNSYDSNSLGVALITSSKVNNISNNYIYDNIKGINADSSTRNNIIEYNKFTQP